jgi:hypothetical protein
LSWSKSVGCTRRAVLIHVEINDGQNQKLQSDFNKLCMLEQYAQEMVGMRD